MKVAVIGQSVFGAEVYKKIRADGHEIVGVFTIRDKNGRVDPLAAAAEADGVSVFKFRRWKALKKNGGKLLPEVFEQYSGVGAELNVLAFVTQFIPMEVIDFPPKGSIVYHPSILPRHRGASAINWTLMCGDEVGGFTVFYADDGLDTGPILLQRETPIEPNDTVNTLYKRFLFPEGVKAMAEAVQMVADGTAPRIVQPEEGATYDALWKKKELAEINWDQPALTLHNFIRGNDKVPGAWTTIGEDQVTLYQSSMLPEGTEVSGEAVEVAGCASPALLTADGLVFTGNDGQQLLVGLLKIGTRTLPASKLLAAEESAGELKLSEEEQAVESGLQGVWKDILNVSTVERDTDFFASGAGSMDVSRLLETVRALFQVELQPEQVFMATRYGDFVNLVICTLRGGAAGEVKVDTIDVHSNDMDVAMPFQLFINGQFCDSASGDTFETINPTTEEVLAVVAKANAEDTNRAVAAAKDAFYNGEWRKMNARDRGKLMFKLADLMEQHKEELATIESLDSGAVYTLALKTHVGMSIDVFRYFAGFCDKIHGQTIPINQSRPNHNLCFTRREPIGVCGLVVPWNYPLMMLAWKMAACLAAGNTVVLKPAQVTPMTALKFAELAVRAGIPPGVINILPGSGRVVGQAIADHADVRKLGFTGSTPIGKVIMASAANSNLKKVSLELGGKSPLIIFEDADLDKAVRQGMSACFFNKGENCIAAGRLFVQDSIHDQFVARVVEEVAKMRIGDPLDRSTAHGPQNHEAHLNKLLQYIQRGIEEGATLVAGGKRVERTGYFLEPTVFTDVADGSYIAVEESFGPIMIISRFDGDVDKVVARANATEFGLASGVFTRDINKALLVANSIEAGTCFINTYNKTDVAAPFGGCKQSGFGKDLGMEALNEYLKTKTVTIEFS